MTPRQLRILRGAASSAIATITAAVSHTIGGGAAPHPLLILSVAVLLTPAAALLVGRRVRLPGIAAAVLATQGAFHVLFHLTGTTVDSGPGPGASGHDHSAMTMNALLRGAVPDDGMTAAHLAAALLTTLLLWRGQVLLLAITHWLSAALRHAVRPVPIRPSARIVPPRHETIHVTRRTPLGSLSRRGPPALARSAQASR
ncbi:MAG: hypothetical protein WA971_06360 [Microbacterium sp.]